MSQRIRQTKSLNATKSPSEPPWWNQPSKAWIAVLGVVVALIGVIVTIVANDKRDNDTYVKELPTLSHNAFRLLRAPELGKDIDFRLELTNTGKTVARKVITVLAWHMGPATHRFNPEAIFAKTKGVPPHFHGELGPGAPPLTIFSNPSSKLTKQDDLDKLMSGEWRLTIFGKVTYSDIHDKRHEYHLCGVYRPLPGADPLELISCPSYNETAF